MKPHIKKQLAKHGYEVTGAQVEQEGQVTHLDATKLVPVHVGQDQPVYVPIPVALKFTTNKENEIENIEGEPDPKAVQAAHSFVKTLADNQNIDGLAGEHYPSATHQLEVNEQGQPVLRRKKFTAF